MKWTVLAVFAVLCCVTLIGWHPAQAVSLPANQAILAAKAKPPKPTKTPKPILAPEREIWPVLPPLDGEGFLLAQEGEFIHADGEHGLWLYKTKDLQVEIQRYADPNKPLIWYESVICFKGDQHLKSVLSNPEKPGTKFKHPETIARKNRLVFSVSDDYFGDRKSHKLTQGIIIRNGKIISDQTLKNDAGSFPNLETMALFPDGSLKVFKSKEHTAEEYLAMGATDVFAFGPILIRDGIANEAIFKKNRNLEPRNVFGMVAPNHYVSIVVEGRHEKSKGTGLPWIAQRMMELGVTQALNLDGGQTVALVFMGEKINTTGKFGPKSNIRSLSGMLGAGISENVPAE